MSFQIRLNNSEKIQINPQSIFKLAWDDALDKFGF